MESPLATVKTCMRPDMEVEELRSTWDCAPKGVKLVLYVQLTYPVAHDLISCDSREDLREAAHDLLREQ